MPKTIEETILQYHSGNQELLSSGERISLSQRLDPEAPLLPHVAKLVDRLEADPIRILDVGAGLVTCIGYKHPTKTIIITPVDRFGHLFARILADRGITPPIRTQAAFAEELLHHFDGGAFDMAVAINSLDHMFSPIRAIRQTLGVIRTGGFFLIDCYLNEGQGNRYRDMHQWNLEIDPDKRLWLWSPLVRIDLEETFKDIASCSFKITTGFGGPHVEVVFQKEI